LSRRGPVRFVKARKAVMVMYVEVGRGRFRFCKAVAVGPGGARSVSGQVTQLWLEWLRMLP
jgi:hypothetical protein